MAVGLTKRMNSTLAALRRGPFFKAEVDFRVESGCIGLEIFGPPHQTKKIFGRSAGVWLKFG